MKTIALAFIALITLTANSVMAQSKMQDWKELKEFHKVMSQTFHPSEEGNLEPIKSRIGEMVQKADALKASAIPAYFNNKKVKKAVAQLAKDSKKLQAKIAAGATDAEITTSLTKLHDVFHKIVGLCSETEDHGDEHEHEKVKKDMKVTIIKT